MLEKLISLSRIRYCRGFGIQSPWAFRLVRDVINERYCYYAYEELRDRHPNLDRERIKLLKLYFRLSNYSQPKVIVDFGASDNVNKDYFEAGCHKAKYLSIDEENSREELNDLLSSLESIDIVRMGPSGNLDLFFKSVTLVPHNGTLLIIEGISQDHNAKRLWKEILEQPRNVVTFDLYYCGLVFFDEKRYKKNYIINF